MCCYLHNPTLQLYKIYGRVSPLEAWETLVKYNTSYIILEDSICLHQGHHRSARCTTNDIVDLSMGHVSYNNKIFGAQPT